MSQNKKPPVKDDRSSSPWFYLDAPALVAHRGDAQNYPENTLLALKRAVEAGVFFIEFDIQLSRDRIPLLMHDDNLMRTAGIDESVFDLDFSHLAQLSVGESSRFGQQFNTEMPISLSDLCEQLNQWPQVHSFIEIKEQSIDRFGLELTADAVLSAIEKLSTSHTLISFSREVVTYIACVSDRSVGWVVTDWNKESQAFIADTAPDFVFCNYQKIPDDVNLSLLFDPAIHWVLYEVTDPKIAFAWRERGAHLIETMEVKTMLKALMRETA